jgi:hypothetical protein
MTSPLILTDYACVPACKSCREAGTCVRASDPAVMLADYKAGAPLPYWAPNAEPDTLLKCGCTVPWPIVTLIARGRPIFCSEHGWQKGIPETEIQRTRRLFKKLLGEAYEGAKVFPDVPPF